MLQHTVYDFCRSFYEYSNAFSLHFLTGASRSGGAVQFYYSPGMKLHPLFLSSDQTENISWLALADLRAQASPKKKNPNQMQMGPQFKCNAGRICNGLD